MVPPSILAKGERVALEYLLESTPLGAFFEREDLRKALAEDIILEQFKPFVFTALFIDEENILTSWKHQRPDSHALARRLATEELQAPYASLSKPHFDLRLRLRMSAYRKLDVWWCGNELFSPSEFLGAEPYFTITLPGHETEPVKIGISRSSTYDSDPKRDAQALELMQKTELITPIERALYPLLPAEGANLAEEWAGLQAVLAAAEPFRVFTRTHKLPAFPKALIVDPNAIPEGFVSRFPADPQLWSTLYALGVSPILSVPATNYLQTKTRSTASLMAERDTLISFLSRSIHFDKAAV